MTLRSPTLEFSEQIPKLHTGDGEDSSPALRWTNTPAGTKSFALIMDDPDAPAGTWVHWVLYDLPATLTELPQGAPKSEDGPGWFQARALLGRVRRPVRAHRLLRSTATARQGAPLLLQALRAR